MSKPTQSELKTAYKLVSQHLVTLLAKINHGEGVRLEGLGTFVKTKHQVKA